jgi:hypothetical protein
MVRARSSLLRLSLYCMHKFRSRHRRRLVTVRAALATWDRLLEYEPKYRTRNARITRKPDHCRSVIQSIKPSTLGVVDPGDIEANEIAVSHQARERRRGLLAYVNTMVIITVVVDHTIEAEQPI